MRKFVGATVPTAALYGAKKRELITLLIIKHVIVGAVRTNCWLAYDSDSRQGVLVDPGDASERVLDMLRTEAAELRYIFLSHGHFDHILALDTVRDATRAPVLLHRADADLLINPGLPGLRAGEKPLARQADILLDGGESYLLNRYTITVMHTPGHTPGSCCLLVTDPTQTGADIEERALFTGDTLFEDDCGRCDLPGGDYRVMLRSLKALHDLPGDYRVFPGHDVDTTLERERRCNRNMLEAVAVCR